MISKTEKAYVAKKEKPENLPESKDKKFWGDGEQFVGPIEKVSASKEHEWRQKGTVAICISCSLRHAFYLDPNQEVRDGKIVAKKVIK